MLQRTKCGRSGLADGGRSATIDSPRTLWVSPLSVFFLLSSYIHVHKKFIIVKCNFLHSNRNVKHWKAEHQGGCRHGHHFPAALFLSLLSNTPPRGRKEERQKYKKRNGRINSSPRKIAHSNFREVSSLWVSWRKRFSRTHIERKDSRKPAVPRCSYHRKLHRQTLISPCKYLLKFSFSFPYFQNRFIQMRIQPQHQRCRLSHATPLAHARNTWR